MTRDNIMLKRRAHQILLTSKPGTILLTNNTIKAFMINEKNPRVNTYKGTVSSISIGFNTMLATPNTMATVSAVKKLFTTTPGRINAVISTAKVLTIKLARNTI